MTRLDAGAFDDLETAYREHFATMMKVAYLMTGSNAAAEDVVHDTFVKCASRLGSVENPGGYLRTAVVNTCRTELRKRQRSAALTAETLTTASGEPRDDAVRDALLAMSPRRRAAVVLRFYEDLSHEQIAQVLECRAATARSLVHRGLADLRGALR